MPTRRHRQARSNRSNRKAAAARIATFFVLAIVAGTLAAVLSQAPATAQDEPTQSGAELAFGEIVVASSDTLGRNDIRECTMPRLARGPEGEIALVYGSSVNGRMLIVMRISEDGGETWGDPELVAGADADCISANTRGARIAWRQDDDDIVVTAFVKDPAGNNRAHLWAFVQTRRGRSFSAKRVSDSSARDWEGMHSMAIDADDKLRCVWLEMRTDQTELWQSTSRDGKRWSRDERIYASPTGPICECCTPALATSADGETVVAQFRNQIGEGRGDPQRDAWLAISRDGGDDYEALAAGEQNWRLPACPMDGGDVAILPASNDEDDEAEATVRALSIYRREDTAYLAEISWSDDDDDEPVASDPIRLASGIVFPTIVPVGDDGAALLSLQRGRAGGEMAFIYRDPSGALTPAADNAGETASAQAFVSMLPLPTTDDDDSGITHSVLIAYEATIGQGRSGRREIHVRRVDITIAE